MHRFGEYAVVFLIGALGYGCIELLCRGHTHWSMLVAGGICMVCIYFATVFLRASRLQLWILGMCIITTVEFVVGAVVNLQWGLNVWDYTHLPLDWMGQICPLFSALWFLLSIPVVALCRTLRQRLFSTWRPRLSAQSLAKAPKSFPNGR